MVMHMLRTGTERYIPFVYYHLLLVGRDITSDSGGADLASPPADSSTESCCSTEHLQIHSYLQSRVAVETRQRIQCI